MQQPGRLPCYPCSDLSPPIRWPAIHERDKNASTENDDACPIGDNHRHPGSTAESNSGFVPRRQIGFGLQVVDGGPGADKALIAPNRWVASVMPLLWMPPFQPKQKCPLQKAGCKHGGYHNDNRISCWVMSHLMYPAWFKFNTEAIK